MSHYADLSEYCYHDGRYYAPGTVNIGWLDAGHEFERCTPTDEVLNRLWEFCKVSVAQMRGGHACEFCSERSDYPQWGGERLLLGTSEIRVFSRAGAIYAAPTLIFHYMRDHSYRPPDEFVRALIDGPQPQSEEYFKRLGELGLEWSPTSAPAELPRRFRFEKNADGSVSKVFID